MRDPLRLAAASLTGALLIGALAIGGGALPRPDRLASLAADAARNTRKAAENIAVAVEDTEALATIAVDVREQLRTSERLLATQLRIERSSRAGARRSRSLAKEIRAIQKVLDRLSDRLRETSAAAETTTSVADASATAAGELQETLAVLQARFDELVGESRELNRKARGYEELRDGPG
ncbi:MAG: hypothetical protein ACRDLB_13915 [Actinomycetota bacterium]